MSDRRITKFNAIKGDEPVGFEDRKSFWKQAKAQAGLVLEEAMELYQAALEEDLQEYLDGTTDVWYLNEYVDDLLKAVGINTSEAKQMVCDNNLSKFTQSELFADLSCQALKDSGTDCRVEEVEYEGELYYVIKRIPDNKVLKLRNHISPELGKCIPVGTKYYFEGV